MTPFLDYALKYAAYGWQVFPLCPGQKIPLSGSHGVKDATTEESQINAWWSAHPMANVAVACGVASGIFVVDIDVSEVGDYNGWEDLKEFPPLSQTIRQNTPRGGAHFFYQTNNPPANQNKFRPGIDIRGDGYYVVVAPSIHPNGGRYKWKESYGPDEIEPAEFPDFMRPTVKAPWEAQLRAPSNYGPAKAPHESSGSDILKRAGLYLSQCEAAVQGCTGHNKLLWAAVAMVHGFLLSNEQAAQLLIGEYNPRCVPPWDLSIPKDRKDFIRKIAEARKLTPKERPGWLLNDPAYAPVDPAQVMSGEDVAKLIENSQKKAFAEAQALQVAAVEDIWAGKPDGKIHDIGYWLKKDTPLDAELNFLTSPTGLLGEICDWINETAMRRQPLLALACALTFCGVLFGRKIRDSLGSRTNLYCMGISASSAGKAHAPNQIRRLCDAAGCTDILGGDDVASDVAIEERISRVPATLYLWDEIGFFLSHIRSGVSQHHVRIVPLLMKLFSAAGSVYKGREYADSEQQRTIIQPCCGIYGTSSPERFSEGISPGELQDGWLSRCSVFRTYGRPPKSRGNCSTSIPLNLCKQVTAWYARQIGGTDGHDISAFANYQGSLGTANTQPPKQIVVPRAKDAEKLFISFDNEAMAFGQANLLLDCLWAKAEETARRIALIVAASENFDSPHITHSNADYACRLVRYLLLDFGRETVPTIVTGQVDLQKQKLLKVIAQAGVKGCSARDITRAARWSTKKVRDPLLADLTEAGEIVHQLVGRSEYFWTAEHFLEAQKSIESK